jgi:alpha-mannosidase
VKVSGAEPAKMGLKKGTQELAVLVPAVEKETSVDVSVEAGGKVIAEQKQVLKPVRKWEIYLLPHSHVDIGYTHLQSEVMKMQWNHLEVALAASKRTAGYPAGAQFKWNVEVLWAVDGYLKNATPQKRAEFIDAVKKGWVGLQALYGNELTGLCRPEELVRLVDFAKRLEKETGVAVDSAMISDVPGYTWGMVPVFANSGVKYFSVGPNQGDRIGYTLSAWGDKPFWWIGPNGKDRILCWIAGRGYSSFHGGGLSRGGEGAVFGYLGELEQSKYPYDMVQVRYNTGGDNGPPDVAVSEFVKEFNGKYAYPKLIIGTSSELCRKFDEKYGKTLPEVSGDFTPYWEDGAASSARETAINREAAERLSQAEALWVMLNPGKYPSEKFYQAWHNVILYDEHTWGAHNSISEPDKDFVKGQWKIKAQFALDAEKESKELADVALGRRPAVDMVVAVDVYNTSSWPRSELVVWPGKAPEGMDTVFGPDEKAAKTQKLSSGEIAFLASDVPAFGSARYTIKPARVRWASAAKADAGGISAGDIAVRVNQQTGEIASLTYKGVELADAKAGLGLNAYRYVPGANPKNAVSNGPATVKVKESGLLVASLMVESDAPGCNRLTREIRVIEGIDRVDIINVVDKQAVRKKEGVHFGFAFNVPNGVMRMDVPFAVVRPEVDQMAGACKNWFTVQRWVDVSNEEYGATWATVDAPMVEVGAITADVTGGVPWIKKLEPTQTLYSYVMNNYWHTNYRADQDGPTTFRYAIRPHKRFDLVEAAKFGVEVSQPLVVAPARDRTPIQPRLKVEGGGVIVTALKPSEDGKGWIVRLFGASGKNEKARIVWSDPAPKGMYLSDITEKVGEKISGEVEVSGYGMVTVRVE